MSTKLNNDHWTSAPVILQLISSEVQHTAKNIIWDTLTKKGQAVGDINKYIKTVI